ncbi:MAG: YCF48-related protein, partial [Limnobacter sp.]|nr:YCF48-related protein [Limnobacter sp.]
PMLDVWFKDESNGWVVGSYGQIFETKDGGDTWDLISERLDNPDYRHYNGLYGDQDGRLIIAGESGRVYLSQDWGQTWVRNDTGYIGHLYGVETMPSDQGGMAVLAYGFGGNVFRLGAGADKWWQLDSPTKESIVGAAYDGSRVVMVDQAGRLMTTGQTGVKLNFITTKEGKPVTGMVKVEDKLYLSAQGGPRMLELSQ